MKHSPQFIFVSPSYGDYDLAIQISSICYIRPSKTGCNLFLADGSNIPITITQDEVLEAIEMVQALKFSKKK